MLLMMPDDVLLLFIDRSLRRGLVLASTCRELRMRLQQATAETGLRYDTTDILLSLTAEPNVRLSVVGKV